MEFGIIEKQNDVTYEVAKVSFPAYEEYKEKAGEVADNRPAKLSGGIVGENEEPIVLASFDGSGEWCL